MRTIVIPGGYAPPPATQPNMPHPPQPAMLPEHDVASNDNDNDQQGGETLGGSISKMRSSRHRTIRVGLHMSFHVMMLLGLVTF